MMEIELPPYLVNEIYTAIPHDETVGWANELLRIKELHQFGTGKGVAVAIVDSGVEDHEDYRVAYRYNTSGESDGYTLGHGTSVAGLIGAHANNQGMLGVAPDCDIIAIKSLTEQGGGTYAAIARGLEVARNNGCKVVNMSLGGSVESKLLRKEVDLCLQENMLIVCAAGNSGGTNTVSFPGRHPGVFCVAAVNDQTKVSAFSSKGWEVDCSAPGERVFSTYKKNSYSLVSGTSFATPMVSGIFACLLSMGFSTTDITFDLIAKTSIDLNEPGLDPASGYGLIDPVTIARSRGGVKVDLSAEEILKKIGELIDSFRQK